ncbi:hypothetical protein WR25_21042 isoform C [Diploscapter pachys]|uniref:MBD domain-containing protein n=2 Tax=Diploscapter pachys TaxID=2018661 RepID=A0A2A2KJP9_9BILA|nr:hypothetical protein WR25_21042 isoform C [Diploscapter pachys]
MDDGNEVTLADTDTGLNKQMAKCCLKLFELFSHMPPDHLSDVEGVISNTSFSTEGRPFCYPDDKLDQILARFEKCRTFEFEAEFGIDQDQLIVGTAAAVLKELRRNFDFTPFCSTLQLDFDTYRHLGALLPVVINKCDPKTLVSELLCSPADCCVLLVIKYLEVCQFVFAGKIELSFQLNGFNPVVNWKEIKFNLDEWSLDDIKSFNDAIDTGARQVLDGNRKNEEEGKPTISQEKMESAISETHQMVESTPNKINQISAEITSTIKSMNITDLYNFRESLKKDREAEREEYSTLMKAQYLLRDEDIEKTRLQLEEAKRAMENAKRLANSVDSAYYGITDTFFNQLTLQVGDFVLARPDMNDLFPLLPAKVIEIDGDNSRYRVQIFETGIINSLTAQDVAIPRVTLCERFVEKTESGSGNDDRMCKYRGAAAFVGLRVAALVKTSTSDKEEWMSGTVAAMPTAIHNNQFLVFFDADFDSYVNAPCYFEHPDVFKLFQYKFGEMILDRFKEKLTIQKIVPMVSQSSYDDGSGVDRFNVHALLRFNPFRAKFLKLYFERYPNYQLARFSKPGPNRPPDVTQYYQGGSKHEGFVIYVDRSMCVIRRKEGPYSPGIKCFDYPCRDVSHQHNDESLFRGSTRIAHINMLGDNNLSSRRKHEVYRRMEYIEPTVDIHSLTENRTQRKSTYLPTDKSRRPTSKKQDNAAELERKKKCENIYKVQHRLVDPQPIPSPHVGQCTNACLRGLDSDTYDKRWVYDSEGKFLCYSPLYIPLLCGYQRKIYTFGSVKVNRRTRSVKRSNVVMYHAPCGRPLRSMQDVTQFLKATHSELTIDLFNFDPTVDPGAYVTVDKKYYVGMDFTKDHEHIPIPYVNSVDKGKHPAVCCFLKNISID